MYRISFLLLLYNYVLLIERECTAQCQYYYDSETSFQVTNCSYSNLTDLPNNLPINTEYLDVSHNDIVVMTSARLNNVTSLVVIDLRINPQLVSLSSWQGMENISAIYVDKGSTCCIFELSVKDTLGRKWAQNVCKATSPYTECRPHLINMLSLLLYFGVFLFNFIVNPWIMIVTLFTPPRRHDATQLNSLNFCAAYLFIGFYASVMFGYGATYYNQYEYYMDSWLSNDVCPAAGYLLITATLATSYLWMLNVLTMFLKLRFPLSPDRHMTTKQIVCCSGGVWVFSFFIAAIPFMANTGYNKVSLCLPFYATPQDEFKYVIMYTVISNISLVVNVTLLSALLYSFVRRRLENSDILPEKVQQATLTAEKKIIKGLTMYVIIAVIDIIFLIMSCVGGQVGVVGREWYARLCVLEAVAGPVLGPLTRRQFHQDTKRLLQRWHCLQVNAMNYESTRSQGTRTLNQQKTTL